MLQIILVIAAVVATFFLTWGILQWTNTRKVTRRLILAIFAAVVFTLAATLVYANLTSSATPIEQEINADYGVDDPQFERALSNLLGPPLVSGNSVTTLLNGDEIFPSMLEAIRNARQSITFETYIYWEGDVGKQFSVALAERARAGVQVHVLIDWLGSNRMDETFLAHMEKAGVKIEMFHPIKWYTLDRVNHRTHRKLLVVDGRIGFTGGVGIADDWKGDARNPDEWRDSHFRVEGPVVAQMQAAFMDNWMKTHADVLHGERYFPELQSTGTVKAQMFKSSANGGSSSARLMFLMSIACAKKSVRIANSYFVADDHTIRVLIAAAKRGVEVEIIVPGHHTDAAIVRSASKANWGEMLQAGIKIYEYQPTMFHCKYMVIDGLWASVGSTNFDPRSFELNDEANLNVLDATFAGEQDRIFDEDKAKSILFTYEKWASRPWHQKTWEKITSLAKSQL